MGPQCLHPMSATPDPDDDALLAQLDAMAGAPRRVVLSVGLGFAPRSRASLSDLLAALQWDRDGGARLTGDDLKHAIVQLKSAGWLEETRPGSGYVSVAPERMAAAWRALLQTEPPARLLQALCRAEGLLYTDGRVRGYVRDQNIVVAMARIALLGGQARRSVEQLVLACGFGVEGAAHAIAEALAEGVDEHLLRHLDPEVQVDFAYGRLYRLCAYWDPRLRSAVAQAEAVLARQGAQAHFALRMALAQYRLLSGNHSRILELFATEEAADAAIAHARAGWRAAFTAALAFAAGRWSEAQAGYEGALVHLRAASGKRKSLLPDTVGFPYVLALLAQQSPTLQARAFKFCSAEGSRKDEYGDSAWDIFGVAIAMRAGQAPARPLSFAARTDDARCVPEDLWRWLMRAWLADADRPERPREIELDAAARLRGQLEACGLTWLSAQLDGAMSVLLGRPAAPPFFVPAAAESWRYALAALSELGAADAGDADDGPSQRLCWTLDLDGRGRIRWIAASEQRLGPRGWGKPKAVPPARLATGKQVAPRDAAVARAFRVDRFVPGGLRVDYAAAINALIGHPHVQFSDAPGAFVDLVAARPGIDISHVDGQVHVRMVPDFELDLASGGPASTGGDNDDDLDDLDDLDDVDDADLDDPPQTRAPPRMATHAIDDRSAAAQRQRQRIIVMRDGAQRARVIRLSDAQLAAARLLGRRLAVPAEAQSELRQALRGLGTHFEVQADEIRASRDVAADSRLRAELTPIEKRLQLRLVAVPLGPDGPRLVPGRGRGRTIAAVNGEVLGALRDLALERAHLQAVLDAFPLLEPVPDDEPQEWTIDEPEQALALLERMPQLPAIAGIDWPRGKPVRVVAANLSQLRVQVRSDVDWFALDGDVSTDESTVLRIGTLLAWSREGKGRYVPIGEGRYLALSAELRARIDDLAAVAEDGAQGSRVPLAAGAWLQDLLDGAVLDVDAQFRDRIDRLAASRDMVPALPAGLQASLRPYQEDGYAWAMRLAQAGFGACLADDMGLGKTLQALAVLLTRAPGGAALVVVPTSLAGNWAAETARFAPSLNLTEYGGADRLALLRGAGPYDVIVVSYTLLQQAAEEFSGRNWHTLVVDEAQAIKNAAAKRAQAVYDLTADFRLALSGTPIENRLAELWSIMRFCNPGLLGSAARFGERFATPIERDRDRDAGRTLRRLIAPFVLRRSKAEVLKELPQRTELTVSVLAEADEAAHYEALRRQALADGARLMSEGPAAQSHFHILAQLTRLRRAACDPRLVSPELGITGAKVRVFARLATELMANRHKALVFSQFVDFLTLLREPLDAAGVRYQYLDGSTPAAERSRRVAAFQSGDGDLFLISLKAGGFGLNLTAADYVVITDPWWNPAAEDQAMGRAHRIGQQRPVTVYRLVGKGTLEESVVALHQDKRALADSVLDGGDAAVLPSTEDLIRLIRGDKAGGDPMTPAR